MTTANVISRETRLDDSQYKWGFDFDYESETAPKGLSEDHGAVHLPQEERTGMDAGMAFEGVQALGAAGIGRADLGERELSPD